MTTDKAESARLSALFALQKLPPDLLSAVVSDGVILSRFGINASPRSIPLGSSSSVERDALFGAFATAAKGSAATVTIMRDGAPIDGVVKIGDDGSALVEIGNERMRFAHGALWVQDVTRRTQILNTILDRLTLDPGSVSELHRLVASAEYSAEMFVKVTEILNSSPEEFVIRLGSKLHARQQPGETDLLPEDARHWDNLVPPPKESKTLSQYLSSQLLAVRSAGMAARPYQYFSVMSLQFSAPELVPQEVVAALGVDEVVKCVETAAKYQDPYALAGAFDICARQRSRDTRFVTIGDELLDALLSEWDRLLHWCVLFASTFVAATVRLATHSATRGRPTYWRRLAAASHASLVVRVFGQSGWVANRQLFEQTLDHRGEDFLLSVYCDMRESPRWDPEWIEAENLAADILGRIQSAIVQVPPAELPPSWAERLAAAVKLIQEKGLSLRTALPSVTQGERPDKPPIVPENLRALAEECSLDLQTEPTPENFIRFASICEFTGLPSNAGDLISGAFTRIAKTVGVYNELRQAVQRVAARVAAVNLNEELGSLVANNLLQTAFALRNDAPVFEILLRFLECYAADGDEGRGRTALAARVEKLAAMLERGPLAARLEGALRSLQALSDSLASTVGAAANVAKLAAPLRKLS